jgi:cytochrome c-type biogenesis protein CcmH
VLTCAGALWAGPTAGAPASAPTPFERDDVRAVAAKLACYCGCPHMAVSDCYCGTADEIRADIARQLDAGKTPEQVVAAFVAEHGTWGLANPPREGLNWLVWTAPFVLLAFGAALVAWLGRRWAGASPEPLPPHVVRAASGDEDEARRRHQAELRELVRRLE